MSVGFFFLDFQLRDFRLQFAYVGVCSLVFLGLVDLGANQIDLLLNRGHNNTLQSQRRGAHSSMLLPVQKSERVSFHSSKADGIKRVEGLE